MSITKKKVPLNYFYSRPEAYFQLLVSHEADQIAFLDESERTRLLMVSSKNLFPMLMQSIMFELKRLDNSKEYDIAEDVKKVYVELESKNSKKFTINDFLQNIKLHASELLNNSYNYYTIKGTQFDLLLIQQKVISSFDSLVIKKYAPKRNTPTGAHSNLTQAQTSLLRVAPKLTMFKNIGEPGIIQLTSDVRFLRFEAEEMIFAQDTYGEEIYYILSGAIQLMLTEDEKKIPITKLPPGQVLGELAPILKQNRSTFAYAIGETKLIGFHLEAENADNEQQYLTLYKNFIKILSSKLLKTNQEKMALEKRRR